MELEYSPRTERLLKGSGRMGSILGHLRMKLVPHSCRSTTKMEERLYNLGKAQKEGIRVVLVESIGLCLTPIH